jgi:hypothetical protein
MIVNCNAQTTNTEGVTSRFGQQPRWLRGVDLNHRPLGYEFKKTNVFDNLQDAGGLEKPCK